jgi:two-component system, LytTR family, response regulator
MIKTILIEDDQILREGLKRLLFLYAPDMHIVAEADTVATAVKAVEQHKPDVVFLDIMIIGGNGFEVLEQYQKKHGKPSFQIVFITAFEEYAIKAFRFSALDYLLKPIDPDELKEVIEKIKQKNKTDSKKIEVLLEHIYNKNEPNKRLALSTTEGIHWVEISKIVYCESQNSYVTFTLENKQKIVVCKTLKEYEDLLTEAGFERIHQTFLINLHYLKTFNRNESTVELQHNIHLPVASRRKERLMELMKLGG